MDADRRGKETRHIQWVLGEKVTLSRPTHFYVYGGHTFLAVVHAKTPFR